MLELFGITHCDTVRKARRWLDDNGVEYTFRDLRKDLAPSTVRQWCQAIGLETLINRRGTTYRQLNDEDKQRLGAAATAAPLLLAKPTLIKRPVLAKGDVFVVGFDIERYQKLR